MPAQIKDLACVDIVCHGFVKDIENFMDTMRVNVAPLRYGAGTKGKVIYALANGLPTVVTSLAAEGMGLSNWSHVALADNPNDFAEAIAKIYLNKKDWDLLAKNGIAHAENNYGISTLKNNMAEIFKTLNL